jgi:hypothetical protein
MTAFMQVIAYVEVQAGVFCKTVGSAYVGSNLTPATPAETARVLGILGITGRAVWA